MQSDGSRWNIMEPRDHVTQKPGNACSLFLSDPYFPVTRVLTRSPTDTINMPSPRLLGIHRAILRVLKLSGAGEYIEQILRDLEQVTVEADGSTNLGDIMRLRFDGWVNQLTVF